MEPTTSNQQPATPKTPKLRGRRRPAGTPAAPKKDCLITPPPAKRLLTAASPTTLDNHGYAPFENNYNGYKCRFLRREFQFVLKFFSQKLLFTKNESLAVFSLSEYFRTYCETQINAMLGPWADKDFKMVNPFALDESGVFNRVFIRLSAGCTYYYKKMDQAAIQCKKGERHTQGRCFAGRVAVSVKGIKFSADGKEVAPIMHVCQVLEHDFLIKANPAEQAYTTCIVDDDTVAPPAPAESTIKTEDTQSLDSDTERVLQAWLEEENQRLDEGYTSNISN